MPISVNRRGSETPDKLLNRFNRSAQRVIRQLRRSQRRAKTPNALKQKTAAIIRERYRAERERRKHYN
jgi:hypothetical protein